VDDDRAEARRAMRDEAEGFTGGPGVVASKSQRRGSVAGILLGAVAGALIGLALGALLFSGRGIVIVAIVGAVAGATFGGTVGGFLVPRRKLEDTAADR
jgi:uncharacterized protein YcfJ